MTQIDYIILLVALLFSAGATAYVTRRYGLRMPNFRGDDLPAIAGLFFLVYGEFAYAFVWLIHGFTAGSASAYLLATFAFGLVGIIDDLYGSSKEKGYKGHFRALLHGKLTTGAAKAIGGGVAALCIGFIMGRPGVPEIIVTALLVGLGANTLNLLDARPGRCLFVFLAGSVAILFVLAAHGTLDSGLLLYIALPPAIGLYVLDARGKLMLGDVGSNAFGAVLGLSIALFCPFAAQVIVVLLLIVFQFWTEKHSLTEAIEKRPALSAIDRRIGIR